MIGCSDYVRSCTEHDVFDLNTVAKVLTNHRDGKDGGIMTRLQSDQSRQTISQIPKFDTPLEKKHQTIDQIEDWTWDDEEPDKEPLDITQPCAPSLAPAPAAVWDGSSPTLAPLRDALQRIEALENLRIGQRLLALEEKAVASTAPREAAKADPGTPIMPGVAQLKADGPQYQDPFPRILLLEKYVTQLGEAVDQRMTELQAKLLPPKAQSADDGKAVAGKLRQVVPSWQMPSDSPVDENPESPILDRPERTRWTASSVPPIMAAVDQAMQAMPPLGRRGSRSVSPGADEAGGVTPHMSRERPQDPRQQRSRGPGDHASGRPPNEHSPSLERRPLQRNDRSSQDQGESSSCAGKTESAAASFRMESRIPILGFGESIPIELLDMKEHKRF